MKYLTFEQVCDLMKRQKERKGMTIRELAEKSGCCDATVFRYYYGKIDSRRNEVLCDIGEVLGLKITPVFIVEEET